PYSLSSPKAFPHVADAVLDVADAGFLVADLALDAQRALVADLLQGVDELADVDGALAERDLLAPGAGGLRGEGVLDVDAADVRGEDLDGAERVALVVEQHVGRVEV